MNADWQIWLAIVIATVVTFGTRIVGPLIMLRVPLGPRVLRFLDSLSMSVIVAVIASYIARGSMREAVAVASAAVTIIIIKKTWVAIIVAVVVAAMWTRMGI